MKKRLIALPLIALLATGAFAQTEGGDTGGDKGGVDSTAGGQAPWPATVGNALFDEGFSSLRPADEAKTRWTALTPQEQNVVIDDCKRFNEGGMTGGTAAIDSALEPLSPASMTAVCTLVASF
ncbi:MAG: hypothetical protein DI533_10070 [Cereibacter sphaeroides]|uniref:Uncharacterized protein n=1 Tax=Cereibacter sphaeroides TaxID=1063 RepID=A0A2W5UBW4_CERSP|nr:MAG: hypothetical protein DI533_10070 [Cereibacter sphaeroides]